MELGTQPIVAAVLILTGTPLGYALRKIIAQKKKKSIKKPYVFFYRFKITLTIL